MIQKQPAIDRIGVTGYPGTLKPRGRSGAVRRSTITPTETTRNATSVPMLVISARKLIGSTPASSETTAPAASTVAGQVDPVTCSRIAARPASWPSKAATGCAATAMIATTQYSAVTVTSEMMIASGIVLR